MFNQAITARVIEPSSLQQYRWAEQPTYRVEGKNFLSPGIAEANNETTPFIDGTNEISGNV